MVKRAKLHLVPPSFNPNKAHRSSETVEVEFEAENSTSYLNFNWNFYQKYKFLKFKLEITIYKVFGLKIKKKRWNQERKHKGFWIQKPKNRWNDSITKKIKFELKF